MDLASPPGGEKTGFAAMSIPQRIVTGYACMTLLLIVTGLLAWMGLQRSQKSLAVVAEGAEAVANETESLSADASFDASLEERAEAMRHALLATAAKNAELAAVAEKGAAAARAASMTVVMAVIMSVVVGMLLGMLVARSVGMYVMSVLSEKNESDESDAPARPDDEPRP